MSDWTPGRIAAMRRILSDFERYAEVNLKIKDKAGNLIPFRFNRAQRYLHERIEEQRMRDGWVRVIGLKGRQQGYSTYAEGRMYWLTSTQRGKQAYILTHEQAATDNLFGMAARFHEHAPFRPHLGAANAKELHFDLIDSGYKVGTAGSKAVGRSSTIQYFHGSEMSAWPFAEDHLAGVLQAVPDLPGTEIILESTANGVGGAFYNLWHDAVAGHSEYQAVFVPWFWQSEYRDDPEGFVPDAEELELAKLYQLDHAQLAWRRRKIKLGGLARFNQEYPCTWEEAFISSGRPAFEPAWLVEALRECYAPECRMALHGNEFRKSDQGELRVWDKPRSGKRYVIGADVAEGLAHGDYSCADVLELPDGYQVAQWHGHIAPDQFGKVLHVLAQWYNRAFLGVERNNHGLATLTVLRDQHYPALYAQHDLEYRGSDDKQTKKFGWLTTSKSKYKIIDQLAAELRDGNSNLTCSETISECRTYIVDDSGAYNAQSGCYDDRVMARAIAGEMLRASYRR